MGETTSPVSGLIGFEENSIAGAEKFIQMERRLLLRRDRGMG